MRRSVIFYLVSKLLMIEGLLLLIPLLVGFIYREPWTQLLAYAAVALILILGNFLIGRKVPENLKISAFEGILIVVIGWVLISFFGSLPFVLTGEIPNLFDAFFEVSSGFTTTGSSILTDLSLLRNSSLFWRSFTHFIGGMGFLVFTMAVLPPSASYVQMMRAEVPGPVFGKLVSRLSDTARILYVIYTVMTAGLIALLVGFKVPVFDAFLLAFATAGTGGFAVRNTGFSLYPNPAAAEWIIGVGMMLFGINFNVFYFILLGKVKEVFKFDEELRYYLIFMFGATALICLNIFKSYEAVEPLVRNVFFSVSSVMTTTGYVTADFGQWPVFSQIILLLLMFIGGSAGSTAGGIKVARVVMYLKSGVAELKRVAQPRRKIIPTFSGKPISSEVESHIANYLLVYILVFIIILLSVSLEAEDFLTAFSSVAATFNNIGPGLGKVGPASNFSHYSNWNKLVLSLGMIAGRLEIYPMILLLAPKTIKRLIKGY